MMGNLSVLCKCGFYGDSLLLIGVTRERFVKLFSLRMERSTLPLTSFLGGNNSDREFASNGLESSSNYAQDKMTTSC